MLVTFRSFAVALALIAVSSAGIASASEPALPQDGLARISATVERIERLLEQLVAGTREQAVASLYSTTMSRITTLEGRLQELEKEQRTWEGFLEKELSILEELRSGASPPGFDDENRGENISFREERGREYEQKAAAVAAKIRDIAAELTVLQAQRQELEQAIADEF